MSRWTDQFDKHPIHETLKMTRDFAATQFEEIDSEREVEQRRVLKVIDLMIGIVSGMDPEFYPEQQLASLNNYLRQNGFFTNLQQFSKDGNLIHLKGANDNLSSHVNAIFQLGSTAKSSESRETLNNLEKAYDRFCQAIEKNKIAFAATLKENSDQVAELGLQAKDLENSFSSLKADVDTQMSVWQKEFTEAQTDYLKEHSAAQNKRSQEFSDAQIARAREYEQELEDFREKAASDLNETISEHDKALRASFDKFDEDVNSKSAEIDRKHKEILTLHGLVTTDGVAGGYKKGADEERTAATWWSVISMICYGLTIGWVFFQSKRGFGISHFSTTNSTGVVEQADSAAAGNVPEVVGSFVTIGFDWPLILATLSGTGIAFVAAQFAGRQSRLHRMNEQRLRWFSFEIAAIDPFISTLEAGEQQELKKQLTEKLFGHDRVVEDRPAKSGSTDTDAIKSIADTFKSAIEAMAEVTKSHRG